MRYDRENIECLLGGDIHNYNWAFILNSPVDVVTKYIEEKIDSPVVPVRYADRHETLFYRPGEIPKVHSTTMVDDDENTL